MSPAHRAASNILFGTEVLEPYATDGTMTAIDKYVLVSAPEQLDPADQDALQNHGWSYDPTHQAWSFYTGPDSP